MRGKNFRSNIKTENTAFYRSLAENTAFYRSLVPKGAPRLGKSDPEARKHRVLRSVTVVSSCPDDHRPSDSTCFACFLAHFELSGSPLRVVRITAGPRKDPEKAPEGPRKAPEGPKRLQEGPERPWEEAGKPQEAPKRLQKDPGRPWEDAGKPQEAPKRLQKGPRKPQKPPEDPRRRSQNPVPKSKNTAFYRSL